MIDKVSEELKPTDPYYVNRFMTKRVITDALIVRLLASLK